jgi:hypothetical protein
MKKLILLIFPLLLFLAGGCKESSVSPPVTADYKEIASSNLPGGYNITLLINSGDSLTTGYNDIFFKVKKNSSEQTNGYVKFYPKMWMTPTYMHSTAVSERFIYDNTSGYFKGYAVFSMVTDPVQGVIWYGVLTYVDGQGNSYVQQDSTPLYTTYHPEKQWRFFYDTTDQAIYMFTLVKPFAASRGLNDIDILLHKTEAHLLTHEELHDAVMSISVYDIHTFTQSSGNVSPVPGSDGFYHGKINLPYSGEWKVCDTIRYQGRLITNNPPPMPEFYYNVH